ncbi:MAG: serine/threonine protein kinase [Ruminococcus sp.]|nr:serine/threonine protein kinase [Ruminococcus sp.]
MFETGTLIEGKYKILDKIGEGGMSVVYRAVVERANKMWAVKVVRKDGKNDYNIVKQNLIAEIETLKEVRHPKLPQIADIIDNDDSYIIIMDYIEGRSLEDIWQEKGVQSEKNVIEWAKQLCEVMGYLHLKNIIYRDMKPSNVMLQPNGEVTIIDFGTAKKYVVDSGDTTGLGTAGYAAPEQYGGLGHTDPATDIYALGMTMYALVTNVDPQKEYVENTSIRLKNPNLSEELDQIISKCTKRERAERYQSCAELLYDLENIEIIGQKKKKTALNKLIAFSVSFLLSVGFAATGFVMNSVAKTKATDYYLQVINDASQTSNPEEKIELYKQAITVSDKAGTADAYLGLIQTYKTNDGDIAVFTDKEAEEIEKLIMNNRAELSAEENKPGYTDICFEIGKMFWYHYEDENQVTRAKYALEWFQTVVGNAEDDYENLGLATVYMNIGIFYRDITIKVNEASDSGMYVDLFHNIETLMQTVADDDSESDIVRLELLEMARNVLHQYPTRLKRDGLKEEDVLSLYNEIEEKLDDIHVPDDAEDKAFIMKNNILSMMDTTKEAVTLAFGTDKGGDV